MHEVQANPASTNIPDLDQGSNNSSETVSGLQGARHLTLTPNSGRPPPRGPRRFGVENGFNRADLVGLERDPLL